MFEEFGINAGYVEDLHTQYLKSPQSVDPTWRSFFEGNGQRPKYATGDTNGYGRTSDGAHGGATNGHQNGHAAYAQSPYAQPSFEAQAQTQATSDSLLAAAAMQGRVYQLVNAYRVRGHLFANVDPLGAPPAAARELDLVNFGLTAADLDKTFATASMSGLPERATLREIIAHLTATYCGSIGVEFTQIEEPGPREWLQQQMETTQNKCALTQADLVRILTKLTDAEIFEQYIHKNYLGAKRFSLEGAESMIAMLDLLVEASGQHGTEEIVFGMAHRGRLNVLVNILGKNPREIFAAFEDNQPERFLGAGDVKYHLGYSNDVVTTSGAKIHLSMTFNPSHLEFVNPVVEGRVRAKQDRRKRKSTVPLLIHGDAAFIGQGVVAETLNLAGLEGYSTGGTIHLVVNNQIGFTTIPKDSRSTRYCTDIARMLRVPVFHVNGEDPEAVVQVTRLAVEFRERFNQDVVIDMYCYRKYGHNEGDEPRFTQPVMYSIIDRKPTVREMYVRHLVERGHIHREQADAIANARKNALDLAREEAKQGDFLKMPDAGGGVWAPFKGGPDRNVPEPPTCVSRELLLAAADKLVTTPPGFRPNAKAHKVVEQRRDKLRSGELFDWGTAEMMAFATLLLEGHPIRLSGQDSRRGTFTHRHAVLFDTESGAPYVPLANLGPNAGRFEVYDSPLSEAGVLGFEYGYSLDRPDGLVMWEAQFGDFLNSAQVIVDQFIISAEDKWSRLTGLTLLLPHGFEGQGPEHSSARIERFLQLSAEDNIQVCNLTTAAQLFHVLRRQVIRPLRKPLVIFTPKSQLRAATSTIEDLVNGSFQRVIADDSVDPAGVKKILLCSGKVFFDLERTRKERGRNDVAIVRIEQYYPMADALAKALERYAPGTPVTWVQEEPRNMGPWYFMNARFREFTGDKYPLSLASRAESASPATGSPAAHQLETKMLLEAAFGA